jgi:hypothetical protein
MKYRPIKIKPILVVVVPILLTCLCNTISAKSVTEYTNASKDTTKFKSIFDGKTFTGWEADKNVWRIENGHFVGEVTPTKQINTNSFLIWRQDKPADFEFYAEYQISKGGNSGINYRSEEVEGIPYAVKGYQADIDGENVYTGQNYEERGRGFLAMRGQTVVVESGKPPVITGIIDNTEVLKSYIKNNGWNTIRIVAKGNNMKHYINGHLMSETTDNDTKSRKSAGLLCLQLHVSKAMRVEYRNLKIKM